MMFNGAVSLRDTTQSRYLKDVVLEIAFEQIEKGNTEKKKNWAKSIFKKMRGH